MKPIKGNKDKEEMKNILDGMKQEISLFLAKDVGEDPNLHSSF